MSKLTKRDFRRPEHKNFYETLRNADRSGGIGFYKLFDDFLTLSACSLAQGAARFATGKIDDKIEAEYMETVRHYDKEHVSAFPHALSYLVNGLEADLHDFLGSVFECSGISNHWHGQFFTPWHLCQMMAKMTLADVVAGIGDPGRPRFTVCEPAVGGGAMLLAVHQELALNPWRWWFDATDIDLRCFRMAYIQLTLAGAPGVVRHGNSLSGEVWRTWPTLTGVMFPHFMEPTADNLIPPPPTITLPPIGSQMSFDLAA